MKVLLEADSPIEINERALKAPGKQRRAS